MADVERRLAVVEARLAIQDMKARYAELVDGRFAAGQPLEPAGLREIAARIAELFTVDGTWDGGPGLGVATGRDEIADRLARPTIVFSKHMFVQPHITVAADASSAIGSWDLVCPCTRPDGTSYWMFGQEDDEYAVVDGAWLHRSMRMTVVSMTPVDQPWLR